jgi:uncharacterized protein YbjQ (UPF0145 family)
MEDLIQLGFAAAIFCIAYFVGTAVERKHFREIVEKEKKWLHLPAVTAKSFLEDRPVARVKFVSGNVVIACDYFKTVVASLASFFGMRIAVAESLVDRVRREAVLRMKQQAPGADIILNLRIETTKIGDRRKTGSVEAYAYGTAIYYQK